jgi:diacylglycerol kinase (ATP)
VKRAFIILNPAAGRGKGRGLERPLADGARSAGWESVVHSTRRAGEEVGLAAEARKAGWPVVVAVGGDGTVHNVVNGLLQDGPTDVTLAHVPVGTGNDYAKALGLKPRAIDKNLALVLGGTVRHMDVGRALGEYFVNGMGTGFDAEVVRQTLRMKHLRGFPLYIVAVYRTFSSFDPPDLEVHAEEHSERSRMMMMTVSIGTTMGGGFRLAPDAEPDDGWLDVGIIRKVGIGKFLRYVPSVMRGTHAGLPEVTMFRSRGVRVTGLSGPLAVELDGELRYPDEDTIEVSIVPKLLKVLCVS